MADTYTIQFRRGMYADFDTSKIRPGEPVAILGNDPSVPSGKALYIAFAANDVRRLCSIEDISEMVNAGEFVGPQGPKGEKGDKGADGTVAFESLTPEQKESLRGISIKSASIDTDGNLIITFSDGGSEDVGNIMGPQGIQGPKGDKGDVGPQGPKGDKGDVGPKGDNMSDKQAAQIEQNKTDIASLKKETGSLKEDLSNKITKFYASSQGETHLADSDNGKIMDMMLYGKSEQKQYSGKNLLNATLQTTTQNGVTCTNNGDGTYTVNGTASADTFFVATKGFTFEKDKKYKIVGCPKGGGQDVYRLDGSLNVNSDTGDGKEYTGDGNSRSVRIVVFQGQTANNLLFKPMITTDLTATYDDFEPYTGGIPSPNPSYPQEIKSVVNPTVKVCGKNLWNEQWINGTLNSSGEFTSDPQRITSKDFIDVSPKTQYYSTAVENSIYYIHAYTKDEKHIGYISSNGQAFTTPDNCYKLKFVCESTYGNTYKNDIAIIKGASGNYEPYHEQTVTLPYDLYGVKVPSGGNVTIDGQQYVSDYFDVERGKLVRMVGEYAQNNQKWRIEKANVNYAVFSSITAMSNMRQNDNIVNYCSNYFKCISVNKRYSVNTLFINSGYILVATMPLGTTLDDFLILIEGKLKVFYQLETPTEIDLTPEEITAFKALATYYPTTNISINSEQLDGYTVFNYPVSMENGWNYVKQQIGDTRDYIYDMDARTQDTDLQAAEAYVNSEYAVALTELEV